VRTAYQGGRQIPPFSGVALGSHPDPADYRGGPLFAQCRINKKSDSHAFGRL
jgi:hypothetical protein